MYQKYSNVSPSFLNEEVRCDYRVVTELKKVWAIQLELLSKFDEVCKANNIEYTIWAGTLLGAVRHHGYIPWDDDLDVAMTRENFEKLLKLEKNFKDPFFLQYALNDRKYFCEYARLRNSETTGIIAWNNSKEYNNGIYIDIFVLDGCPTGSFRTKKYLFKRKVFLSLLNSYYGKYPVKKTLKNKVKRILLFLGRHLYSYERLYHLNNKNLSCFTKKTNKIGLLTHGLEFVKKYWCYKEDLLEMTEGDFEGLKVPMPKNYDQILKNMYGDYMSFPKVEERGQWHNNIITYNPDMPYIEYFLKNGTSK